MSMQLKAAQTYARLFDRKDALSADGTFSPRAALARTNEVFAGQETLRDVYAGVKTGLQHGDGMPAPLASAVAAVNQVPATVVWLKNRLDRAVYRDVGSR